MLRLFVYIYKNALVAELVDALDSKSSSFGSVGSIPTQGTFIYKALFNLSFNVHLIEFNFCKLTTVPHSNPPIKFNDRTSIYFH